MTMAAVKNMVDDAPKTDGWQEPQPLLAKVAPVLYPFDALPEKIRAAVAEVQSFTQAPVSLVACSALASLSVAAQSLVDMKRAEKLFGLHWRRSVRQISRNLRESLCPWLNSLYPQSV